MFLIHENIDTAEIDEKGAAEASKDFLYNSKDQQDQEWLLWDEQINKTVKWFTQEEKPINFVLFNTYQPSNCIRTFGPYSDEARQGNTHDTSFSTSM